MLIDTHCHLDQYDNPQDVVAAAEAVGVGQIIAVGMHAKDLLRVLDLAKRYPIVAPAMGLHPQEVQDYRPIAQELPKFVDLIRKNASKLVAIAEIGLDHHFVKDAALWPLEEQIFQEMLPIAEEQKLPVSLHVKGAEMRVLEMLTSFNIPEVVFHWFSGPPDAYKMAIDRGYYFSIPQAIRYSPRVIDTAKDTPLDHLLLESDGPAPFKGEIGEPKDCAFVIGQIAQMRQINRGDLEQILEENTRNVFPRAFQHI